MERSIQTSPSSIEVLLSSANLAAPYSNCQESTEDRTFPIVLNSTLKLNRTFSQARTTRPENGVRSVKLNDIHSSFGMDSGFTVIFNVSYFSLYTVPQFLVSVLKINVQSPVLEGTTTNRYVPAPIFLPSIVASSLNVNIVGSFAPARHTSSYFTTFPQISRPLTPGRW